MDEWIVLGISGPMELVDEWRVGLRECVDGFTMELREVE